jgi:hypothetical protein
MATLEISVTQPKTKQVKVKETFELADELAQEFISRLEALLADVGRSLRVTKTINGTGHLVVEIEAGARPLGAGHPTFEERYRRPRLPAPAPAREGDNGSP